MRKVLLFFILFAPGLATAAEQVIYEHDFSTDPGWTTDDQSKFYWDSTEEALYMSLANSSTSSVPDRYFYTSTDLATGTDFTLTWDQKNVQQSRNGMAAFGLLPDSIFSTSTSDLYGEGWVMSGMGVLFGSLYEKELMSYKLGGTGDRSSWTGRPNFGDGRWYSIELSYSYATGTLTWTITDKDTELVFFGPVSTSVAKPITFGDISNLGVSGYFATPPGSRRAKDFPNELMDLYIDNVLLTQPGSDDPVPDPLSDLLLQYEPVLYFHPDEDYFPMNVDAFVEGSGLWDSKFIDENLIARGEGNDLTLDYLATTTDTDNWYIAFSSDQAGTINLAEAKTRYDALTASGKATSTYYAHEMFDEYTDDFGTVHRFKVLQYWYFYAMNNWREQGGFNDHEGDWESVFVFLDADTEEPLYAAFSAHHNDGSSRVSVRRNWNDSDLLFDNTNLVALSSLGSHANYADNGNQGVHITITEDDVTSDADGISGSLGWENKLWIDSVGDDLFSSYSGKWGTDLSADFLDGKSGPRGPFHTNVSGTQRFHHPVKWAGIDKVTSFLTPIATTSINFRSASTTMEFSELLAQGTIVTSDRHDEVISAGLNAATIDFLPRYWDFTTTLPNGSFSVEITVTYTDEELEEYGLYESELAIFYYNPLKNEWELVDAVVDEINNTITFTTSHFSEYAIGGNPEEPVSSELVWQKRWGQYDDDNNIQYVGVSVTNEGTGILQGTSTLLVSDITDEDITLENYDRVDSFGYYLDIDWSEYGRCLYDGNYSSLPSEMPRALKQRLIEYRSVDCEKLLKDYPELTDDLVSGVATDEWSDLIGLQFNMSEGWEEFDFEVSLVK